MSLQFCSSVNERRKFHCAACRAFELTYRLSLRALEPVAFGQTDAEKTIRKIRLGWTWLYTPQKGPSEAYFSWLQTLTVSFSEVGGQKSHCSAGSRAHGLGAQLGFG